jgi:hypothetical protein
MCTYFKDTSGLSTSHLLLNLNKKETDKRNKEARSGSMRTANNFNRYNINTRQLYKTKDNERGGALRGRISWRREG